MASASSQSPIAGLRPAAGAPLFRRLVGLQPAVRVSSLAMQSRSRGQVAVPYRPRAGQSVRMASSSSSPASSSPSSRSLHSSTNRSHPPAAHLDISPPANELPSHSQPSETEKPAPLSVLPLSTVLRSLGTTTISSSPILLPPSLAIMSALANSTSPFLNPDKNPLLHYLIKKTFYAQFCAGENMAEVRQTMHGLKNIGFSGVILGYAREVVLTEEQTKNLNACDEGPAAEDCLRNEIMPWAAGNMETVRLAEPGDYVALKFTGAGRQALYLLAERLPPSPALAKAIGDICTLAASRGIRLLFDAEQQAVQAGIDDWTLTYMRKYNSPEKAIVYGTYQAYLKATPATLSSHLKIARDEGFTLGVKLVRGAYLGSDPRHLIHDTKADTDAAYDGIAEALLRRQWRAPLITAKGEEGKAFPNVNMVLASHNAETVRKGRAILESGARGTEVAFAQLQGMADEVSCELVYHAKGEEKKTAAAERLRAYKYLVWGSTGECMKYLLRRAQENRDAVQRTKNGRDAMRAELWRRMKAVVGLA